MQARLDLSRLEFLKSLVEEETGVIEDQRCEAPEARLLVVIEEAREDVGYLRWIVPLPWIEIELVFSYLCDSLDGENSLRFEVIEVAADCIELLLGLRLQVVLDDLCEQHLPDSDHAAPASISHEGTIPIIILQQLWESRAVGDPEDALEVGC